MKKRCEIQLQGDGKDMAMIARLKLIANFFSIEISVEFVLPPPLGFSTKFT